MNGTFYGIIQAVDSSGDRLFIRCVREYYHGDGLMSDDVWIWEIEGPEENQSTTLQSMIGRPVCYFEVMDRTDDQSLVISLDEGHEVIGVSGKQIRKKEEPKNSQT